MVFKISVFELRVILIGAVLLILDYFVFGGFRDWFIKTFPNISPMLFGIVLILGILYFYKFRG